MVDIHSTPVGGGGGGGGGGGRRGVPWPSMLVGDRRLVGRM